MGLNSSVDEDWDNMLAEGSWMFARRPMILKIWTCKSNLKRRDGATFDIAQIAYARLCVEIIVKNEQPDDIPLVNERMETFM
ncbi:hypothetical protein LIER_33326 [Lithospermum erythrorhizon]|uniref:Uncharacterized protein n=1 Tax=Lithospermum erythrorhizon TaxID=34254 RepID=A0AAV3RY44_LITER